MGDVAGLLTIQQELERIGCQVRVFSVDSLSPEDRERDLILLRGPDANDLSRATMERYAPTLSMTVPGSKIHDVAFYDNATQRGFAPQRGADGDLTLDYGLIIRVPNPLGGGRKTEILILAGCWGYGTTGAAEAICDPEFLQNAVIRKNRFFEALVRTAVHADAAHYQRPELTRPLELDNTSR